MLRQLGWRFDVSIPQSYYGQEVIIRFAFSADPGYSTADNADLTGVWIDGGTKNARKICAIGVKCSRWVTMHGIGFNINSNLDYFKHIVPCGIEDKSVTSLQKEINQKIDMKELKLRFKKNFKILFGINWVDKK